MNILVTSAGQADEDGCIGRKLRGKLEQMSDRVSAFEGRNNPLHLGQHAERGECLVIGHRHVFSPAEGTKISMLGADAGIIEAGRHRMGMLYLAVTILQKKSLVTV